MTLPISLSSLGLPGAALGLLGGLVLPHKGAAKGASTNAGAAALGFAGVLNAATLDANGTAATAKLTALVKGGMPISTIAAKLANQVADALARLFPGAHLDTGALRTSLVASIRSALSPPANAPPGSPAAAQVAALVTRLKQWLNGITGEANQQNGQQNDIAGDILDANSAKEIPAQPQGSTSQPSALGTDALAQSLLASVAAALSAGAHAAGAPDSGPARRAPGVSAGSTAPAKGPTDLDVVARLGSNAETPAPSVPTLAAAPTLATAKLPSVATPPGALAAESSTAPSTGSTPADLLARMLARAAGVDAQRAAPPTDPAAPPASAASAVQASASGTPTQHGTTATSAGSFASAIELTTLLEGAIAAAAQGDGDSSPRNDLAGNDARNPALPAKGASSATPSAFAVPTALAPPSVSQAAATQVPASTPALDPSAVIEGLVKSMAMRTSADGTSELRLRLQPESLGTVNLKLTVAGNTVVATATTQNADARIALLASQQQLARSLAGAGLKLTGFTVNLAGGNAGHEQPRDRNTGLGRRYTVHEAAGALAETAGTSDALPALVPQTTLGLLSYLV